MLLQFHIHLITHCVESVVFFLVNVWTFVAKQVGFHFFCVFESAFRSQNSSNKQKVFYWFESKLASDCIDEIKHLCDQIASFSILHLQHWKHVVLKQGTGLGHNTNFISMFLINFIKKCDDRFCLGRIAISKAKNQIYWRMVFPYMRMLTFHYNKSVVFYKNIILKFLI